VVNKKGTAILHLKDVQEERRTRGERMGGEERKRERREGEREGARV